MRIKKKKKIKKQKTKGAIEFMVDTHNYTQSYENATLLTLLAEVDVDSGSPFFADYIPGLCFVLTHKNSVCLCVCVCVCVCV